MKSNKFFAVATILTLALTMLVGCAPERVDVGYEGLLIKLVGDDRGMQRAVTVTGRVWVNHMTEDLVQMPIFAKIYPYSVDARPGSPEDEALYGSDKYGTQFVADWTLEGNIISGMGPVLYEKYRMDFDDLLNGPIRLKAESFFNRYTAQMSISDIVGEGRNGILDYMNEVARDSMQYVELRGQRYKVFEWTKISFIGAPRPLSPDVTKSIESITSAKNDYIAAVTRVRQDSTVRVIEAMSTNKANKIITESLSPLLVDYEKAKNWRPLAIGGSAIVNTSGK